VPGVSAPPPVNGNTLGNTIENTTDQIGGPVGEVSPQLGQGVTDTGQALGEIVQGLPVGQTPP
jgi:hypothetical protein